jgi:pyruvate dehydrogenase E2 component (dihydrolipoamide acetyltransferase)
VSFEETRFVEESGFLMIWPVEHTTRSEPGMAHPVTVPRLGWSMDEGTFVEWVKRDGDLVRPGDALFVLESDKAAESVESLDGGILRVAPDGPKGGDTVKVGQVLGHLVGEGEAAPVAAVPEPAVPGAASSTHVSGTPADTVDPSRRGNQAVTPRARRVARELGVDLASIPGSGRNGRVRERDVRASAGERPAGRLIPHTHVRRVIAARMVAGVTQAAPVTLTTKADATNLVNLRNEIRAESPDDAPTSTDLLVTLAASALKRHPMLQAQWREEGLFVPDGVHVGVAVDTEAGLLVPVIQGADTLTVREVAARSRELIAVARAGELSGESMRGATFTVTNLGMFGVDAFTPIIHLPQCAVLGVGRIVREPCVVEDRVVPRDVVTLSLTFDHRVIDGAPAARFLDDLRRHVEQPAAWLVP